LLWFYSKKPPKEKESIVKTQQTSNIPPKGKILSTAVRPKVGPSNPARESTSKIIPPKSAPIKRPTPKPVPKPKSSPQRPSTAASSTTYSHKSDTSTSSVFVPITEIEELQTTILDLKKKITDLTNMLKSKDQETQKLKHDIDILEKMRNDVIPKVEIPILDRSRPDLQKEIEEQEMLIKGVYIP
jgi:hypothetical protein